MMKIGLALWAIMAGIGVCSAEFDPRKPVFSQPFATKAPVLDGRIVPGEYPGEYYGLLKHNSPYLSFRQGSFYTALAADGLYLAMRSELPPPPLELMARVKKDGGAVYRDDSVEFWFAAPGGKALYQLIVNSAGFVLAHEFPIVNSGTTASNYKKWNFKPRMKSGFDHGFWTLEMQIPLQAPGAAGKNDAPQTWKIFTARDWQNPAEPAGLNQVCVFADLDSLPEITFAPETAGVRFVGMGENYAGGKVNIEFAVDNPSGKTAKIKYSLEVASDASPKGIDGELEIAPGKSETVALKFEETSNVIRELKAKFVDLSDNRTLYLRSFSWFGAIPKTRWNNPGEKRKAGLEFGVYPYFKQLKARIGNPDEPLPKEIAGASFRVRGADGRPLGQAVAGTPRNQGFAAEWKVPEFLPGEYALECTLTFQDGKKELLTKMFEIDKFPWEHNDIGMERIILPPYRPIQYPSDRALTTLMSGYLFRNGFFAEVAADGNPNILAAPVELTINGKKPEEKSFSFTEKSPDQAANISHLTLDNLTIKVEHQIEYDNFVKTTLNFIPSGEFQVDSMILEIPLKAEVAKYFHSVCNVMKFNPADDIPQGHGVVWDSSMGKLNPAVQGFFRPYLWAGDIRQGFAWFAESDKNWSRDFARPMLELVREKDRVIIRVILVNKKILWNAPVEMVMGFQSTPTRPRPKGWRKMTERVRLPDGVNMCTMAGSACWGASGAYDPFPANKDYRIIDEYARAIGKTITPEQQALVEDYMRKYFTNGLDQGKQDFYRRHLLRGFSFAAMADYIVPYQNPRNNSRHWPENSTYMDEWFCAPWRANNEDDYNNTPTGSYQDFYLWHMRELLRRGMSGIYYDNVRDWHNPNSVTGPAYELPDGSIQPYFDIFSLRELVKRTAVLLYRERKTFLDGRPLLVLHMTNTNVIPFTSFAGVTLDLEDKFGSMDFQDRFSESWLKTTTIGTQAGNVPEVLVQMTGRNLDFTNRTFLAVTLAYDIPFVMHCGGNLPIWKQTWEKLHHFGYASDDVEVIPCYESGRKVKTDSGKVRLTTYENRRSGEMAVAVCSFGHEGGVELVFDFPVSGAVDFETFAPQKVENNRISLRLNKNDFRLLKLKKGR